MKRYLLIFTILMGAVCSYAQSKSDQAQVLQQCIDLPSIQSSFIKDGGAKPEQLGILVPGFAFPTDLTVTKFGKNVRFLSKSDLNAEGFTDYLFISKFEVKGRSASVTLIYYRNAFSNNFSSAQLNVELSKSGDTWNVVNSNIEKN